MEELESSGAHGSAVVALGPPSFTSPQTYNTNWYNKSFEPAANANTTTSSNSIWTAQPPAAAAGGVRPMSGAPFQEQQQSIRTLSAGGIGQNSSSSSSNSSNTGFYQHQPRQSLNSGRKPGAVMQNNLITNTGKGTGAAEEVAKYIRG
jgi:hypothetical protein